jgi:hypothetical protein
MPIMTIRTFFRWIAWLLVFAIAAFTLLPIELRPVTGASADLERFAAFAIVGASFYLGYPKHRCGIVLLVIGITGLLELAQHFVPARHGRLPDGIVKASGALPGAAVTMFIERGIERYKGTQ